MTSLNMSSSYNTRFEESFQTLQLLTRSQECSPIQQLYSASSSNMSPQVLFPNCQMQKKLSPQFHKIANEQAAHHRSFQQSQSNLLTLLQGEVHQSFQIDENPCVFNHITESNLHDRFEMSENKQNAGFSGLNSEKSLIKINFTVSRHIQENLLDDSTKRCPLKQFELKMQDLRNNVGRLKTIVDRFQNPEKRDQHLQPKRILSLQSQYANKLNCLPQKNTQSTESGNKISGFNAKSAQSQNLEGFTPIKQLPVTSEFQIMSSVSNCEIAQMSPIISVGQFSQLSERALNTSQISSRMLMKKKFHWKSNRTTHTV